MLKEVWVTKKKVHNSRGDEMKKGKKLRLGLIGLAIVIIGAASIYSYKAGKDSDLEIKKVERFTIPSKQHVFVNGNIAPQKSEVFGTELTKGKVNKIHVQNNQEVKIGMPVVTYKKDEVSEQIKELNNQIDDARELKRKAESTPVENIDPNAPNAQAAIPGPDYSAEIKKLERQLTELSEKEYTTDYAGIDGIAHVENTQLPDGTQADKIVLQSKDFVATGNVSEKDVLKLQEGMDAELTIVSNEKKLSGKLESISKKPSSAPADSTISMASPMSGGQTLSQYDVKFSLQNQEQLMDGFHVQAKLVYGENRILIPKTALIKEGKLKSVFLIKDGILKKKTIELGETIETNAVVLKGLKENDEIVLSPSKALKEGDKVE